MKHMLLVLRNALIGFVVASGIYLLALALYWLFYPYTIAIVQEPISIENIDDRIAPGDILELTIVVSKLENVRAEVSRTLICSDNSIYSITPVTEGVNIPTGDFIRTRLYYVPNELPVGLKCVFQFDNYYQPNPIRTIHLTWQSEPFEVVERSQ